MMETSCFSETQLTVRDAIAKICSNFPDVLDLTVIYGYNAEITFRNIGQNMTFPVSTHMSFMLL